jgi:hypothetical protein
MTEPSPRAIAACRGLVFEAIQEQLDLVSSYATSAREAAWRGSPATLKIHLDQLRLCVIDALKTFKSLDEVHQ